MNTKTPETSFTPGAGAIVQLASHPAAVNVRRHAAELAGGAAAILNRVASASVAEMRRAAEEERQEAVRAGHWTGAKYDGGRDVAAVAKDIRADIAAAKKAGDLPKGLTARVRISRYSGGQSVTIAVTVPGLSIENPERAAWVASNPHACLAYAPAEAMPLYSVEAREILAKVEAIGNAYNYDKSDTMTDYHNVAFFLTVGWG